MSKRMRPGPEAEAAHWDGISRLAGLLVLIALGLAVFAGRAWALLDVYTVAGVPLGHAAIGFGIPVLCWLVWFLADSAQGAIDRRHGADDG